MSAECGEGLASGFGGIGPFDPQGSQLRQRAVDRIGESLGPQPGLNCGNPRCPAGFGLTGKFVGESGRQGNEPALIEFAQQ